MNYITTTEAAEKWGISSRRVLFLAREGRIPDVKQIGTRWLIPENAEKPADARTRAGKTEKLRETDGFRFPGFEYRPLSSFDPPLSEEELSIKAVTEAFYACRFRDAERLLGDFPESVTDRYLRINALYTGCMLDIILCNTVRFLARYDRLTAELQQDFPHKTEMLEYLYSIKATLGDDAYYSRVFRVRPDYDYHASFLPRLANLSAVSLTIPGEKPTDSELRAHELNCIFLKDSKAYADLVSLHLYLGIAYGERGNTEMQKFHIRNALILAEKHEVYYCIAYHYYHMRKLFKPVMAEFPEDFRKRLEKLSLYVHRQYVRFTDALSMNTIYKLLPHDDYIFLHYALQQLSNKEIADRLHSSVGTIGKRFSEIYALLGVEDKKALIALYEASIGNTLLQ